MAHYVHKTQYKSSAKRWAIVNKVTGQTVGHSDTKRKAEVSAQLRDGKGYKPKP
jgi:hypothetical protein